MAEDPITPHAAPSFDQAGNLTYVGDDGRRYVVGLPDDQQLGPSEQLLALLQRGDDLWPQLEQLSRRWMERVSGPDLPEAKALLVLLAALEGSLRQHLADGSGHKPEDEGPPNGTQPPQP